MTPSYVPGGSGMSPCSQIFNTYMLYPMQLAYVPRPNNGYL